MTPLHCASLAGNLSFVQSATTALVDEVFPSRRPTALADDLCVRYLVSKGARTDAIDTFGFSAMHHAAYANAADVCLCVRC